MAIECPHCFTYVHVGADGQCPSCRCDTTDVRGLDRDLATVVIGEKSPLPDICCACGIPARRYVRIKKWKPIAEGGSKATADSQAGMVLAAMSMVFGLVFGPILHLLWKHTFLDRQSVSVIIPQCEACSVDGPPQPLRVDYEHFTMRFVVHRIFKSHFERIL